MIQYMPGRKKCAGRRQAQENLCAFGGFFPCFAVCLQGTYCTLRRTGAADISAKQHHPVTEIGGFFRRKYLTQLAFYLKGILASVSHAQPSGDADAVGVADISRLMIDVTQNQIGGFAADAGEGGLFLLGTGNFAAVLFQQLLGTGNQILGLGVVEPTGMDISSDFFRVCLGEAFQRREAFEQCGGHQIDSGIRALR